MQTYPHDSAYDGVEVYLPDISKFLPGDLLLTHNANDESGKLRGQSKAVVLATRGTFDHVMICAVSPTFVEAIPPRVGNFSIARTFAHSLDNVRVLRYPDAAVADKASRAAQQHIGRNYSILRAGATVFPLGIAERITDKGIFCSALAAHLFVEAGAREFDATPILKTTPATIEKMACMRDVTALVFEKALAPANIEQLSALDGTRRPSPGSIQASVMADYYEKLFPLAEPVIDDPAFASKDVPFTFFDILKLIIRAHSFSVTLPSVDQARFVARIDALDSAAAALIDSGGLQEVFQSLASTEDASLQRTLAESFNPSPDIDIQQLKQQLRATADQIADRNNGLAAFRQIAGRSKASASWIALTEISIAAFVQREQLLEEVVGRLTGR